MDRARSYISPPSLPPSFLYLFLNDPSKAMEELVDLGLVKNLGLSNGREEDIAKVSKVCRHAPKVDQVELHPMWPQRELKKYCEERFVFSFHTLLLFKVIFRDIIVEAYSPMATPNMYDPDAKSTCSFSTHFSPRYFSFCSQNPRKETVHLLQA